MKRTKSHERRSKKTDLPAKWCNICGLDTVEYQVIDNAPICYDCVPKQENKIIPNETNMIKKLLRQDTL